MSTLDLSRVPHLAERQVLKALIDQKTAINAERIAANKHLHMRELELMHQLQEEYQAVQRRYEAEAAELSAQLQMADKPFCDRMLAVDEEMEKAVEHLDCSIKWCGSDDLSDPKTCAVTDLPLFDDDRTWRNADVGEALLCLLPPIFVPEEWQEAEATDEATIQAAE